MDSIEGIKYIIENEYRNPQVLADFRRDIDAARTSVEALTRAQKGVGSLRAEARQRRSQTDSASSERSARKRARLTGAQRKEVAALLRSYRARNLAQERGIKLGEEELQVTTRNLDSQKNRLDSETQARRLAAESDKKSLAARKAALGLRRTQNKEEKAILETAKKQLSSEDSRRASETAKTRLNAIKAQNAALFQQARGAREVLAIQQALLRAEQLRTAARNTPDGDPARKQLLLNQAAQQEEKIRRSLQGLDNDRAKEIERKAAITRKASQEQQKASAKERQDKQRLAAEEQKQAARAIKDAEKKRKATVAEARARGKAAVAQQRAEERTAAAARGDRTLDRLREQNKAVFEGVEGRRKLLAVAKEIRAIERARVQAAQTADPLKRQRIAAEIATRREAIQRRINAAVAQEGRIVRATNRSVNRQRVQWGRVGGTIRRVTGALIVYQGLARALEAFVLPFREAITFGNEMEVAESAIGGLVSGAGTLRNNFGGAVDNSEKFAAAISIGQSQMAKLQSDALGTSSTFKDLVKNFQLNVRTGLNNGLNIDEFREISRSFGQAATLFGLEQNQLAEEIRSVLQGTIQIRNTRIAAALGITNEDIRKAKERNELAEFLQERFEGINAAVENLRNSLPIITSDLQDAFQAASREGGSGFRQQLTNIAADLRKAVTDSDGDLTVVSPATVAKLQTLFEPLERSLTRIRPIIGDIGDFFLGLGSLGVSAIEAVASTLFALSPLLQATTFGIRLVSASIQGIAGAVAGSREQLGNLFNSVFGSFDRVGKGLAIIAGIITGRLIAGALLPLVATLTGPVVTAFKLLGKTFLATFALFRKGFKLSVLSSFIFALAAVASITTLLKQLGFEIKDLIQDALQSLADSKVVGDAIDIGTSAFEALDSRIASVLEKRRELAEGGSQGFIIDTSSFENLDKALDTVRTTLKDSSRELSLADTNFASPIFNQSLDTSTQGVENFREQMKSVSTEVSVAKASYEALVKAINQKTDDEGRTGIRTLEEASQLKNQSDLLNQALSKESKLRSLLNQQVRNEVELLVRASKAQQELAILAGMATLNEARSQSAVDPNSPFAAEAQQRISLQGQIAQGLAKEASILTQMKANQDAVLQTELKLNQLRLDGASTTQLEKSKSLTESLAREQRILNQDLEIERLSRVRTARELAALEENTTFGGGRRRAVNAQVEDLRGDRIAERGFGNVFGSLRQNTEGAIRAGIVGAFTGQPAEIKQFLLNFGADAATSLLNGLAEFGFEQLFSAFLPAATDVATDAALTASITGLGVTITGLATAVATLATAVGVDAATPFTAKGGLISTAPRARAFGRGGNTGGHSKGRRLPRAPRGADPRDKIVGLMRPNEFVVTPEMGRKQPGLYPALEGLRRAVHFGASMPNMTALAPGYDASYASGGSAAPVSRPSSSKASTGSQGGSTLVVPVMVTDSRSMRRVHSSPELTRSLASQRNRAAYGASEARRRRVSR